MGVKEKALTAASSIASGDFLRMVTSGGASRKIDYSKLAKAIVEEYNGSTIAGSAQTLKAALDSLNSKWHELIEQNQDLDDMISAGLYDCASGLTAQSLSNCPTTTNFVMLTLQKGTYCTQLLIDNSYLFARTKGSSGWSSWIKFVGTRL